MALFPLAIGLGIMTAVAGAIGVWKARYHFMPLWFVLLGMIMTKTAVTIENWYIFSSRPIFTIEVGHMIGLKLTYIIGTSLQCWGTILAMSNLPPLTRKISIWSYVIAMFFLWTYIAVFFI